MKLIIDIDEDVYKKIVADKYAIYDKMFYSIKNGTPLPKGHGRLIDGDALQKEVSSWGMNDYEPLDFTDAINEADTIIEADKEGKE